MAKAGSLASSASSLSRAGLGVALLIMCVSTEAHAAEWSIVTVDEITLEGAVVGLGEKGELLVLPSDGSEIVGIPLGEIVEAQLDRPSEEPDEDAFRFTLRNGDEVIGTVHSGTRRDVVVSTPHSGNVSIALTNIESVASLRFRPTLEQEISAARERDDDIVLTVDGDVAEGIVESIGAGGIVLKSEVFGDIVMPLPKVGLARFSQYSTKGDEPTDILVVVFVADGSRLTGRLETIAEGAMSVKTLLCGDVRIHAESVRAFYVRNGRFRYLSDMVPASVEEEPYWQGDVFFYPFRRDLTCTGNAITLGGRRYLKGLGVHSRCELTYELAGQYSTFVSDVGVDDEVLGRDALSDIGGNVLFRVLVDGKPAMKDVVKRAGEVPERLRIDVKGASVLTLVVDWGDDFEVLDRADWAGARLSRHSAKE